jgi:predicted nucleic acid-binding protein
LTIDAAIRRVEFVRRVPLEIRELQLLIVPALGLAISRGLSVYDACNAVLAEAEGAVLVTADRGLAAAVTRPELV